jgi:hypothetical protein
MFAQLPATVVNNNRPCLRQGADGIATQTLASADYSSLKEYTTTAAAVNLVQHDNTVKG